MQKLLTRTFSAILFDLDGTIIDSTPAVVAFWHKFGAQHSIDPAAILASSHGCRTIDVIAKWKPELATWENVIPLEAQIPIEAAKCMSEGKEGGAVELPGARRLIDGIVSVGGKWAIVTSGTKALAEPWIKLMNLPRPAVFITADLVSRGKPDPEGYLSARTTLTGQPTSDLTNATTTTTKTNNSRVVVIEDAPAGVRAGKAAGCEVIGLLTTHTRWQLIDAGADYIVEDLASVEFVKEESRDAGKAGGVMTLRIKLAEEKQILN